MIEQELQLLEEYGSDPNKLDMMQIDHIIGQFKAIDAEEPQQEQGQFNQQ